MQNVTEKKIGLFSIIGITISAIIGAGIFNLMKEIAHSASVGVTILSWGIVGVGMGSLAFCMASLHSKRPDLDSGIFSYAQEGFGQYIGFNSAWGYWICLIIANVARGTMLFNAVAYFFPAFDDGQNIASIVGASILFWTIYVVIIKGMDKASLFNTIVLIAKIIPILIFIVCLLGAFNKGIFFQDFWGKITNDGSSSPILVQLKGTVLSTVFVFVGIEGAMVISGRAKKQSDVAKATMLGFAAVTVIYATVTIFSFGILSQEELRNLPNPAMAYVLEYIIGKPGAIIVNIGVIISIIGSCIANTLLAQEVAYQAGLRKLFPQIFTKENQKGMPGNAILITILLIQTFLISFLITDEAYSLLSKLSSATILLPYTCITLFQLKTNFLSKEKLLSKNWLAGIIATIYMFWLIYASGTMYVVLTIFTSIPGTIMYIYVQKKNFRPVFNKYERVIFLIFSLLFLYGIINISTIIG